MINPDTQKQDHADFSAQKEALRSKFQFDMDALDIAEANKMITSRTESILLEMLASDNPAMISEAKTAIHRLHDCAMALVTFLNESSIIFDTILNANGQELFVKLLDLVRQEGPNNVEEIRQFLDENTQSFPENYKRYLNDAMKQYEADLTDHLTEFNELPLLKAALAKQPAS